LNEIVKFTDSVELITLDKEQIAKINERLVEFHRVKAIVGHSTSQSSYSLQTLNMISDSPLSRMKQCISQINKKYQALQEAYFKIENKKLIIQKLSIETDAESKLTVRENESLINTISISMENALREIGMFQNMYDSIRKNNNIPENWSEKDYEEQEIANMIKSSFRIAIQDLTMTGRISKSAVEYWEQLGIHPQMGETLTRKYQVDTQEILNNIGEITIQLMYDFLDEMADRFKDAHKEALKHIGLDELGSEEFMAHGATKPQ
tara:strand:+ start:978 stop:1769 length:792 start_codon:yes stop_codon:yes gene_type:complete